MAIQQLTPISIQTTVKCTVSKVWEMWTGAAHITKWCQASDDWHAPYAENDVQTGGNFKTTMAAKDGSFSFDFEGVYTKVDLLQCLEYTMSDGRKVSVRFIPLESDVTSVVEVFEPESENPQEMQQAGWQAILNSFKRYAESQS